MMDWKALARKIVPCSHRVRDPVEYIETPEDFRRRYRLVGRCVECGHLAVSDATCLPESFQAEDVPAYRAVRMEKGT